MLGPSMTLSKLRQRILDGGRPFCCEWLSERFALGGHVCKPLTSRLLRGVDDDLCYEPFELSQEVWDVVSFHLKRTLGLQDGESERKSTFPQFFKHQ